MMISRFTFATLASAILLASPVLAGPTTVRLIAEHQLQPTSTLEFRFEDLMVPPEKIGFPAELSPVVLTPTLQGAFVWLSQRSGVFKPQEPYALGTTYALTLAPGLRGFDGRKINSDFHETVETPPLQLKGWNSPGYLNANNATAQPRFSLLFNSTVAAGAATPFIHYQSDREEIIAARVE